MRKSGLLLFFLFLLSLSSQQSSAIIDDWSDDGNQINQWIDARGTAFETEYTTHLSGQPFTGTWVSNGTAYQPDASWWTEDTTNDIKISSMIRELPSYSNSLAIDISIDLNPVNVPNTFSHKGYMYFYLLGPNMEILYQFLIRDSRASTGEHESLHAANYMDNSFTMNNLLPSTVGDTVIENESVKFYFNSSEFDLYSPVTNSWYNHDLTVNNIFQRGDARYIALKSFRETKYPVPSEFSVDKINVSSDISFESIRDEYDNVTPFVSSSYDNIQYHFGDTDNVIEWTIGDENPDYYEIYKDNELLLTNNWISNMTLKYNVDGLNIGIYNYTVVLFDKEGNQNINSVIVEVLPNIDNTMPEIFVSSNNISYYYGDTGNVIEWTIGDENPDTYMLLIDGEISLLESWSSNMTLTINIDGLFVGTYNFTLILYDTDGNINYEIVVVTVLDTDSSYAVSKPDNLFELPISSIYVIISAIFAIPITRKKLT